MPQLALDFDARRLPSNGTPTSQAAAASLRGHVGRLEAVVLDAIRAAGERGATDAEVEQATGLGGSTVRPRRVWLRAHGYVRQALDDDGEVVKRPTQSGRAAVVWIATGETHGDLGRP